jgi:hypothetical protein
MSIQLTANKFSLDYKVLNELKKINCFRKIIPLPLVYYRLGVIFHLTKKEAWFVLKELENKGFLETYPYKGIKILK